MNEQLANRLKRERAIRGWSISEAARRCGIQRGTLSALENGERGVYSSTLQKIADAYDVTVPVLMGASVVFAGEPTAKWVLTATDEEYTAWLENAERKDVHEMFAETLPEVADTVSNEALLGVAHQRARVAVGEFFRRLGI